MHRFDDELTAGVRALGWIHRSLMNDLRLALDGGAYSVTESRVVSELARQDAIDAMKAIREAMEHAQNGGRHAL